jgi:hypothetical protein
MALQNDYVFGMSQDVDMPSSEEVLMRARFDLQASIEIINMRLSGHPDNFNSANLGHKIQSAAYWLSLTTSINYPDAQQIILNYCLHTLVTEIPVRRHILDRIQMFLNSGADVNSFYNPADQENPQHKILLPVADWFGNNKTPLMLAVRLNHINVITLLRQNNADLLLQDNDGNTALILAVKTKSAESFNMVKALVDPKENPNHVSFPKALQIAEQEWRESPIEILNFCINPFLDNGINIQNNEGYTALMYAAENGDYASVNYLIDNGADTTLQNNKGYTALMYAAENNDYASVNYLINNDADTTLKNNEGKTAFELAPVNSPVKGLLKRHAH